MVSDSNTPRDGEDRRLRPPRPGKSVDPEKSLNMAESFEVFTDEIRALNSTMRQMSSDIKNTLDMQARYTTDRRRQSDLHGARDSVADHPAETGDATMGVGRNAMNMWNWQQQHRMSGQQQEGLSMGPSFDYFIDPGQRLTGTEGTQSLSHFRTWAAQAIGEKVAGHRQVFNPDLLGGEAGGEALHERPGISRFRSGLIKEENKRRKRQGVQDSEQEEQEFSTHQEPIPDDTSPDSPEAPSEEYQPRHAKPESGRTTGDNVKRPKISDPKGTDYAQRRPDETGEGPEVNPSAGRIGQQDLDGETERIRDSESPEDSSAEETPPVSPKGVSNAGEQPTAGQTTPDGVQGAQRPSESDERAGQVRPREEEPRTQPDQGPTGDTAPSTASPRVPTDPNAGQTGKQETPETPDIPTDSTSGQVSSEDIAGGRDGKPDVPGSDPVWPREDIPSDHVAGYTTPSQLASDGSTPVDGTPEQPHAQREAGEEARQETQDGPADGSTTVSGHEPYVGKRRSQPDQGETDGQARPGNLAGDSPRVSDPRDTEYSQAEPGEGARQEAQDGPADGSTALSDSETPEESGEPRTEESESGITSRPVRSRIPKVGKHRDEQAHDPNAGQTGPEALAGGGGAGEVPGEGEVAEGEDEGGGIPPGGFAAAGAILGKGGAEGGGISAARTRIGSAIAQSGGTGAGLSMALRRMPVVGLGLEAVSKGTEFYQDQREQGRQYQSMTGTSGAEGWVDKRREDWHRWSNFFKFDGGRSREQFQTATAAGYNDQGADAGITSQSREGATNFLDRAYHDVGMDTGEAGQHLDAAARNTFTPLNDLVDTLGRLSESAGEAGINAEKARESFGTMFSNITGMGYGESAMQGAATLQQAQTNLGKQFEDTDMSAMYGPEAQMLAASQSGMSYGEIQNLALTDPNAYLSEVSGSQQEIMGSIDPEVQAAVEELSAGKDLESEAEVQGIRDEILERFPDKDWNTMAMVASQMTGMQMGPEQYITWMIKTYGGHGLDEAIEEEQEHEAAMESGSASEVAAAGGSGAQAELQDSDDPGIFGSFFPKGDTELQGLSNEEASEKLSQWYDEGDEGERGFGQLSEKDEYEAASALEMSDWGSESKSLVEGAWGAIAKDFTRGQAGQSQYLTGATNQYFEKYTQKGKADPFLETLLQEAGDHDQKVKVPIAGGGDRVVSLEEAVQHYGAQLSSGDVEFVEGDLAGKTTGEVAGMEGTGELEAAGDENTTQENLDEMGVGEDYEKWAEENPEQAEKIKEREEDGGEGGGGDTTMIDLTPEAKRIFQIQSGEGDPASATGMPNDPSQGQVNQRGGTSFPLGN